jgi:hypothetical protein
MNWLKRILSPVAAFMAATSLVNLVLTGLEFYEHGEAVVKITEWLNSVIPATWRFCISIAVLLVALAWMLKRLDDRYATKALVNNLDEKYATKVELTNGIRRTLFDDIQPKLKEQGDVLNALALIYYFDNQLPDFKEAIEQFRQAWGALDRTATDVTVWNQENPPGLVRGPKQWNTNDYQTTLKEVRRRADRVFNMQLPAATPDTREPPNVNHIPVAYDNIRRQYINLWRLAQSELSGIRVLEAALEQKYQNAQQTINRAARH